jgi:hypothetical protein
VYSLLESNYEQIKGIVDDYNSSEDKTSDDQHMTMTMDNHPNGNPFCDVPICIGFNDLNWL